jgi:hypothetical protein
MSKIPKDFLMIGRGAEYAFSDGEAVFLVSAGMTTRVDLVTEGGDARVMLDHETEIMRGKTVEVAVAFGELRRVLLGRTWKAKAGRVAHHVKSLAVTCAAVSVVAVTSVFFYEAHIAGSVVQQIAETPAASPSLGDLPQFKGVPKALLQGNPLADAPKDDDKVPDLRVQQKPDFLSDDNAADADKSAGNPVEAEAVSPAAHDETPLLPAYNPDLYKEAQQPSQADRAAIATHEAQDTVPAKSAELNKSVVPGEEKSVSAKSEPMASRAGDKKTDPVNTVSSVTAERKETVKTADTETDEASGQKKAVLSSEEQSAIKKSADAAVQKMLGDGMKPDDVRKLLLNLQALQAGGSDQLTPDMLKAMPEEVAALLTDKGMDIDPKAQGEINILPTEIVDRYRGKDGIATIPENYSWYARTGGPVTIPLPGGGDIKKPEDLKEFGFQP